MKRLLATAAVLTAIVVIPAAAIAEPGNNGPQGPEGNPNYDSTEPAESGASTDAPGNSGSNPHGGPGGPAAGSSQSTATPGGETVATAPAPPPTQQSSGTSSNATEPAPAGAGGGGPADKITICHATGSETNPYVVITVSENATTGNGHGNGPAHQNDEDVIPVGSGGSCPSGATEPPTVIEDEGEQGVLGRHDRDRAEPDAPPAPTSGPTASPSERGELPFTGMFVGALLIAGVVAMTGGVGLRRASRESERDDGGLDGLSRRRGEVAVQASAWTDSVAARTTELGERIASLERSVSD